jgi:hypothetical protein
LEKLYESYMKGVVVDFLRTTSVVRSQGRRPRSRHSAKKVTPRFNVRKGQSEWRAVAVYKFLAEGQAN